MSSHESVVGNEKLIRTTMLSAVTICLFVNAMMAYCQTDTRLSSNRSSYQKCLEEASSVKSERSSIVLLKGREGAMKHEK